jgi:hypothetical protein
MELDSFDEQCLEILEALPDSHSKHYFRSAINHLKLGEKLYPFDSSMGVFRYITAEEEAASGLMQCLKDKGYTNAEKLNTRSHKHKNAIIPIFTAIRSYIQEMATSKTMNIDVVMAEEKSKKTMKLVVNTFINGEDVSFAPTPPLNFCLSSDGKRLSFKPQLESLASSKGVKDVVSHIEKSANNRNRILYASKDGYPSQVEVEPYFFTSYQNRVFSMLRVYLMIVPYEEKMQFVQDVLDATLNMLGSVKLDDIHSEI